MKQVSAQYVDSMKQTLRNESHAIVEVSKIDYAAARDGAWTTTDAAAWSDVSDLDFDHTYGTDKYATLELHRWMLDGSFTICPTSDYANQGYVSASIADENGEFENSPTLVRELSQTYPMHDFAVFGEQEEWATSLSVTFNGTTETVTPTDFVARISFTEAEIDNVTIAINTVLPYHRARLRRCAFGDVFVFTDRVLTNIAEKHDIDPLSRRLPDESVSFTIIDWAHEYDPMNPQSIIKQVDKSYWITVRYGYDIEDNVTEWLTPNNYKVGGLPVRDGAQITFNGVGLIKTLPETVFEKQYAYPFQTEQGQSLQGISFYDKAIELLQDIGLPLTPHGENPWVVDEVLKDYEVYAPFKENTTHKDALQTLAYSTGCRVYSHDYKIHIEQYKAPTIFDFTFDAVNVYENGLVASETEKLKNITVNSANQATSQSVWTPEVTLKLNEQGEVDYHFTSPNNLIRDVYSTIRNKSGVDVSASSFVVYAHDIYAHIVKLALAQVAYVTFDIRMARLTYNETPMTYQINADGTDDSEENYMLNTDSSFEMFKDIFTSYLNLRNTYDIDYRGNPELEVGDGVLIDTDYDDAVQGMVIYTELNYDGALHGKVKVKALQ